MRGFLHLHLENLWVSWRKSSCRCGPFPDCGPPDRLTLKLVHTQPWAIHQNYNVTVPPGLWCQRLPFPVSRSRLCLSRFWVARVPRNLSSLMGLRNVIDFPRKSSTFSCGKDRMISKLFTCQKPEVPSPTLYLRGFIRVEERKSKVYK